MFTNDTISAIRHRDAEEQAAKVDSTPFALSSARNAARAGGNHELADMLDRRLASEHPKRTDYYTVQEAMSIRLAALIRTHRGSAEAARIINLRNTGQISAGMATEMYNELAAPWVAEAESILEEARKLRSDATRNVEQTILKVTEAHPGNVQEHLLFESQATRAWDRLRTELDALSEVKAAERIVEHITESTSPQARKFLIEEGSVYLKTRGYPKADDVIRAALIKSDPRVALADSEETNADHAASTVEYNARHTIERISTFPNPRETTSDLERIMADTFLRGEKTRLGQLAARQTRIKNIQQGITDTGFTVAN